MNKKEEAVLKARIKELEEINSNLESELLSQINKNQSSKKKTKKKKPKNVAFIPLTAFIPKAIETTIKILPAIDLTRTSLDPFDLWYDWKTNRCPNCSGTERIKIPEYPTEVCKECWVSRCLTCGSVISIKLDGTCSNCEIEVNLL